MASRTSWVFAKGAVLLIVGGFVALAWQDLANKIFAFAQQLAGSTVVEPFSPLAAIAMIVSGFGLGFLAYLTR